MDISQHRPICDLFVSLYGRVFNNSDSIICKTSSPLLLLVLEVRSSIPKILEGFSLLLSIFGYLVLRKRDENTAEHVIMKNLYLRTGLRK